MGRASVAMSRAVLIVLAAFAVVAASGEQGDGEVVMLDESDFMPDIGEDLDEFEDEGKTATVAPPKISVKKESDKAIVGVKAVDKVTVPQVKKIVAAGKKAVAKADKELKKQEKKLDKSRSEQIAEATKKIDAEQKKVRDQT